MTFIVPAILSRQKGRRTIAEHCTLFLDAEDRADAMWQARHGVLDINVQQAYPGAKIKYDLRRLAKYSKHVLCKKPQ